MILSALFATLAAGGCLQVEGDSIRAAEMARIVPEFSALPPESSLGYAPAPGVVRTITGTALSRAASRFGVALGEVADVCVERAGVPVKSGDAQDAMQRALAGRQSAVEIVELSQASLPRGSLNFPLSGLLPASSDGVSAWRGWLTTTDGRRYAVPARVKLTANLFRVVAIDALVAGMPIQASNVREERIQSTRIDRTPYPPLSEVVGRTPRRSIQAGTCVTSEMLDWPKAIRNGQAVELQARSGPVVLRFQGVAAGDARIGDWVPVKSSWNGTVLRGRVEGPSVVVVDAEAMRWRRPKTER